MCMASEAHRMSSTCKFFFAHPTPFIFEHESIDTVLAAGMAMASSTMETTWRPKILMMVI